MLNVCLSYPQSILDDVLNKYIVSYNNPCALYKYPLLYYDNDNEFASLWEHLKKILEGKLWDNEKTIETMNTNTADIKTNSTGAAYWLTFDKSSGICLYEGITIFESFHLKNAPSKITKKKWVEI